MSSGFFVYCSWMIHSTKMSLNSPFYLITPSGMYALCCHAERCLKAKVNGQQQKHNRNNKYNKPF